MLEWFGPSLHRLIAEHESPVGYDWTIGQVKREDNDDERVR